MLLLLFFRKATALGFFLGIYLVATDPRTSQLCCAKSYKIFHVKMRVEDGDAAIFEMLSHHVF